MNPAIQLFQTIVKPGVDLLMMIEKLNDEELQQQRYSVCQENEGICYNAATDQCQECSCFMKIKTGMLKHRNVAASLRVEVTHCPLAKWNGEDELEIVNFYRQMDGKQPLILKQ